MMTGSRVKPSSRRCCFDVTIAAAVCGCGYYLYEQKVICDECARRFAWSEFLVLSERRIAKPANWL